MGGQSVITEILINGRESQRVREKCAVEEWPERYHITGFTDGLWGKEFG